VKTIVHVNQHVIKANAKNGERNPALTIKNYRENRYGHEAVIWYNGIQVGRFVYSPDKPLSCGAKVWFETNCEIEVITHDGCIVQDEEGTQVCNRETATVC